MASSRKKRAVEPVQPELEDDVNGDTDDEDLTDESENEFMDQEVQVEFEARPPDDNDYHGIKCLLHQLFLKSHVNLADLADIIIMQNYVGSVIKQVDVEEDDEEDMDDDSGSAVFGLITAVNITNKQSKECIKQLIAMLTSRCKSAAPEEGARVEEMLQNQNDHVGFLINERFINIPPQIAVPSFKSLRKDFEKACRKNMNYAFKNILMFCKTYRFKPGPKTDTSTLFYSNAEEEFIAEMSDIKVTWSVADERDGVADGRWDEDEMEATRTMLLFSAEKLDAIINKLDTELGKE